MRFRSAIFIELVFARFGSKLQKKTSFDSQDPDLNNHEKVMFIHPVINAQLHAKVVPFLYKPLHTYHL